MPVAVVVGMQWGDEGKGKIIDLFAENVDVVARYQGGHNAGHTICFDEKEFVLHLIPSGIFHKDKLCVITQSLSLWKIPEGMRCNTNSFSSKQMVCPAL